MSDDMAYIAEQMRLLRSDNEDLRRRVSSILMIGQIDQTQGDKQRVVFDEKDASTGEPFKSPLLRRASASGANGTGHKERSRLAVGETVAVLNPNGEIGKHSRIIPYGPTDESAEPAGDDGFARIFSEGNASFAVKDGEVRIKVGGVVVSVTSAGIDVTGGHLKHDGKSIDKGHVHGGIVIGGSNTQPPSN